MASLTLEDIDEKFKEKVYVQDYSKKPTIEGLKIVEIKNFVGEDGDFSEIIRLDENGSIEGFEGFKLAQVNRTKMLPGVIKAWHLHLGQDEFWYVTPSSHLLAGFLDLRKNSSTKGIDMRIPMGGGKSQLIFIPKGVAHGCANVSKKPATMLYFVDQKFNINNPDEQRLSWDILGKDYWQPKRD